MGAANAAPQADCHVIEFANSHDPCPLPCPWLETTVAHGVRPVRNMQASVDYERPTLVIADDHPLFRHGLRMMLAPHFDVLAEVGTGREAIEQALQLQPYVVLMDVAMPDLDGIEATREIRTRVPNTSVVVISATDEDSVVLRAFEAGASGYTLKHERPDIVIEAVRKAARGEPFLPTVLARRLGQRVPRTSQKLRDVSNLSGRELAVLRLLGEGRGKSEISRELGISLRTVGAYLNNIYAKLCISDRREAIIYAIKHNISKPATPHPESDTVQPEETAPKSREAGGKRRSKRSLIGI